MKKRDSFSKNVNAFVVKSSRGIKEIISINVYRQVMIIVESNQFHKSFRCYRGGDVNKIDMQLIREIKKRRFSNYV